MIKLPPFQLISLVRCFQCTKCGNKEFKQNERKGRKMAVDCCQNGEVLALKLAHVAQRQMLWN